MKGFKKGDIVKPTDKAIELFGSRKYERPYKYTKDLRATVMHSQRSSKRVRVVIEGSNAVVGTDMHENFWEKVEE